MRALLVMLVACGHEIPRPDAAARALDLDVTVGHDGVEVFANGTDGGSQFLFPQVGQSTVWGDADTLTSCLTEVAVEAGGNSTPAVKGYTDGFFAMVDVTAAPDAVLAITGCGGAARIAIGGLGAPRPSVVATADPTTNTIAVAWTTHTRARTALLTFDTPAWAQLVHVAATSYTFVPTTFAPPNPLPVDEFHFVSVHTFDTMSFVETPYGIVKIWPGDAASATITVPSAPN